MELTNLPILSICGASGSGKTTLIEQTLNQLRCRGLKVAVAKQSPKPLIIDQAGKDSARFFAAGADILFLGPGGVFSRKQPSPMTDFRAELMVIAASYDLILIEGYHQAPGHKIWLLDEEPSEPPADAHFIAVLGREIDRLQTMVSIIEDFLSKQWLRPPVLGCVLIGGKSRRMGQPKHLLCKEGVTWLQRTVDHLTEFCHQVVVVGEGEVRDCSLLRLPDIQGCEGPLSGLLSAMRWQPWSTVLACACDLPAMTTDALRWLLQQREPGALAVIPKIGNHHEPLLALYDFRIRPALETMAFQGVHKLSSLVAAEGVRVMTPPLQLQGAWHNINYPDML